MLRKISGQRFGENTYLTVRTMYDRSLSENGELRADAKREEFRRLLQEAYDVGKAKGVHLEEEI